MRKKPIEYNFIYGQKNRCDCISRCLSYKQLIDFNYHCSPDLNKQNESKSGLNYIIPAPHLVDMEALLNSVTIGQENMIDVTRFSRYSTLFTV